MNPEQQKAVETIEGPLLVLAGAGSGKTRVIVHRIAHLLSLGINPESILAVTFTNKAAAEMRERVAGLTRKKTAEKLTVSTFHSFGAKIVQEQASRLGLGKRPAIFDTQDQVALIRRVMNTISVYDREYDQRRLASMISRAKNAGLDPAAYMVRASDDDPYEVVMCELYPRYQKALKVMGGVDFDDLILMPLMLMREHGDIREYYSSRFRHILVDEYQDTSRVQVKLLELLAGPEGNVCAVGDDDQSIYAWRGAEVDNILRFERTFPKAKEIRLTRNYRSTRNILDSANAVIAGNKARRGKDLWTEDPEGEPVKVVICPDEDGEAEWVVDEMERLFRQERLSRDDFAILFRTNGQARPFEEALRSRGIEHKIVGGTRFFDRKEVRDGLAYLRVCANPMDDISLSRITNYPSRGIGDTTLERLQEHARARGDGLINSMRKIDSMEGCSRASGSVREFVHLLDMYRHEFSKGNSLASTARKLFMEINLFDAARNSVKSRSAGDARVANIESLLNSIASYESRESRTSLPQYLSRISLGGRDENSDEDERGKVTLLTLHAAKGLEFPVVFLAGMEEGLLPHSGMQGEPPNMPEERRLAYVGITRAMKILYLCRAAVRKRHGRLRESYPSRFLEDLPPACIEIIDTSIPRPTDDEAAVEAGKAFFAKMRAQLGSA